MLLAFNVSVKRIKIISLAEILKHSREEITNHIDKIIIKTLVSVDNHEFSWQNPYSINCSVLPIAKLFSPR